MLTPEDYRQLAERCVLLAFECATPGIAEELSITVVIFCWRNCLISESMGHHNSEIMDDGGID